MTECLPISSSSKFNPHRGRELPKFYRVQSHLLSSFPASGSISAVLVLYRDRFFQLIPFLEQEENQGFSGWRGISFLALTTLPAVVVGAAGHHFIKTVSVRTFDRCGGVGSRRNSDTIVEKYKPDPGFPI